MVRCGNGGATNISEYVLTQAGGTITVGPGQEQGKLLATKPDRDISWALHVAPENIRDQSQTMVAEVMAPGVVDALEVVGINQSQGQCLAGSSCLPAQFGQEVVHMPSVL